MGRQAKWDSVRSRLTALNPQVSLSFKKIFIYLFIWQHRVLMAARRIFCLRGMKAGSNFLTRDQTWVSCIFGST